MTAKRSMVSRANDNFLWPQEAASKPAWCPGLFPLQPHDPLILSRLWCLGGDLERTGKAPSMASAPVGFQGHSWSQYLVEVWVKALC